MENSLISIIVPVYNTKPYMERCINSLCNQTYKNLEIILVNDGSTDDSGAFCDELAKRDERIRVYHKENGGSSSARNLGLQVAKGEWIGFVDSDDYTAENMYELLYKGATASGVKMAQIGRREIAEDQTQLPNICNPPEQDELVDEWEMLKELLMHRGDCSFCTKLFHREILEGMNFPVGALNEDFHLLIELLPKIGSFANLSEYGYYVVYRLGSNTRKETGFSRVFSDNIDNADWVMGYVLEKCPALTDIAFRFGIFQRIDYMLHIPIKMMTKDNVRYGEVVSYLRRNYLRSMKNPVLTVKNKAYHTVFAFAPKLVRQLHSKLKGFS